jgi:hypothetical protein
LKTSRNIGAIFQSPLVGSIRAERPQFRRAKWGKTCIYFFYEKASKS